MDTKARPFRRPLNHCFKREFVDYLDDKKLRDAEIAQYGIEEEGTHADGLHKHHKDPFARY